MATKYPAMKGQGNTLTPAGPRCDASSLWKRGPLGALALRPAHHVLLRGAPETDVILLTNGTAVNLIRNKNERT